MRCDASFNLFLAPLRRVLFTGLNISSTLTCAQIDLKTHGCKTQKVWLGEKTKYSTHYQFGFPKHGLPNAYVTNNFCTPCDALGPFWDSQSVSVIHYIHQRLGETAKFILWEIIQEYKQEMRYLWFHSKPQWAASLYNVCIDNCQLRQHPQNGKEPLKMCSFACVNE